MPEELGNLLIRVTSVGFDEVIESLHELEAAASEVSSNSSFAELQDAVNEIAECVEDLTEGMRAATHGFTGFGAGAHEAGQHVDATTQKLKENQSVLATLAKAYASFWVMFNAPRKLFDTLDGVAKFNRELTSMSVSSNMSRGALMALGTAAAQFGGSAEGIASLGGRFRSSMQNLRIGRGGGAWQEAATLYGLDITGSGAGGLATTEEGLRNIVKLLPNLTKENQLGLKDLLGIDDGTFQLMLKGLEVWDKAAAKQKEYNERLKASEKGTEEWNKATAELKNEWQLLQNEVFKQLGPIVKEIVVYVKDATEFLKEHPALFSTILGLVTAIGTAIAAWKFAKFVGEAAKLLGILRNIRAVAAGTNIGGLSGSAGGAAGGVGGAAAGIGLAGKALGAAMAGDVISNAAYNYGNVEMDTMRHDTLVSLMQRFHETVSSWHAEWFVNTFGDQLIKTSEAAGADAMEIAGGYLSMSGNGSKGTKAEILASLAERMEAAEGRYGRGEDSASTGRGARKSGAVSISGITINVTSSAANAEEVAKAVREEFFAQVNASIEDAVNGSRVL